MAFTFDGVEIATERATMVKLDCGDVILAHPGIVEVGDEIECPEDCDWNCIHGSLAAEVTPIEIVPTVHIN